MPLLAGPVEATPLYAAIGVIRQRAMGLPHGGARGLVPGLGHDELQRDLVVAQVVAAE